MRNHELIKGRCITVLLSSLSRQPATKVEIIGAGNRNPVAPSHRFIESEYVLHHDQQTTDSKQPSPVPNLRIPIKIVRDDPSRVPLAWTLAENETTNLDIFDYGRPRISTDINRIQDSYWSSGFLKSSFVINSVESIYLGIDQAHIYI
ncbi:hypothetical protein RUM44_011159 [Polyplax serrata]|uniref:Uncharacterized protein n=1 Tax=Polyplax serrata TaxID=468196 RepID=A0ABR1AP81_POLSC